VDKPYIYIMAFSNKKKKKINKKFETIFIFMSRPNQ